MCIGDIERNSTHSKMRVVDRTVSWKRMAFILQPHNMKPGVTQVCGFCVHDQHLVVYSILYGNKDRWSSVSDVGRLCHPYKVSRFYFEHTMWF
jgi:hypothetical protein